MNLRKSLWAIILLTMSLFSINMKADGTNPPTEIIIQEEPQEGIKPRLPDYGQTLSCFLFEDGIRFYAPYQDVLEVVIHNTDNGCQGVSEVVISGGCSGLLPLYGNGHYEISITTNFGKSFYGEFDI